MRFFGAAGGGRVRSFEEAFTGCADCTSPAMRQAVREWFGLYFDREVTEEEDPCQRIPCVVVGKLSRAAFAEYEVKMLAGGGKADFMRGVLDELEKVRRKAVQLALIGGESWIKPVPCGKGFRFAVMRRDAVSVLSRDITGRVTGLGSRECLKKGRWFYTLLEKRTVDGNGYLTIENRLFRSDEAGVPGSEVKLDSAAEFAMLEPVMTLPRPVFGVGAASVRLGLENCVDGSADAVSVYAAAVGLIHNINRNERQLSREFENGESRIFASADLLTENRAGRRRLPPGLFVGLDEDPGMGEVTIFAPGLRQESFLQRRNAYLRAVESLVGMKRGLLSEVEAAPRTATEVTSSEGDYSLTVQDIQQAWQRALCEVLELCDALGQTYGLCGGEKFDPGSAVAVDWGDGVLYDRKLAAAERMEQVKQGLLAPEAFLGWYYSLPCASGEERAAIRRGMMPGGRGDENKGE